MNIKSWKDAEFSPGEVKIKVMHESESTKEIQIALAKGSAMKEHKAPYGIAVQLLRGSLYFSVGGDRKLLDPLDMITLEAKVPHALEAVEDSIVRLTLSKNDSISRVEEVLK